MLNIKSFIKRICMVCLLVGVRFFPRKMVPGVRVVILHGIRPDKYSKFEALIGKWKEQWRIISPDDFFAFLAGQLTISEPALLITYDDGFASSVESWFTVLKPQQIRCLFFISTGFVDLNEEQSYAFSTDNLKLNGREINSCEICGVNSEKLKQFVAAGNFLGSHTVSHAQLSKCDQEQIETEVIASKRWLQEFLARQRFVPNEVDDFAYPFGDVRSMSIDSFEVVRKHFKRIYTGCRGLNQPNTGPIIYRDAISLDDPIFFSEVYLSGILDVIYRKRFAQYVSTIAGSVDT